MQNTLLDVTELSKSFGGLVALNGISFKINLGDIVSLIGPNGAGKTTLFNCLTGIYIPESGKIKFNNDYIGDSSARPCIIAQQGIIRTFQNIRLFQNMTAQENIMVGRHLGSHAGWMGSLVKGNVVDREELMVRSESDDILKFMGLSKISEEMASSLSYGHQRKLEIARALAADPKLLLLDEPAAGMNPNEVKMLMGLISRIRDRGITILLIEHHMNIVMGISDSIIVLDHGEKIAQGKPKEVQKNKKVIDAYLGVKS